ncbi:hypothetical protein GCM10011581_17870 [Saccharopolyspora subtropica]|uniref:Uncharacterized protein n=1 Tax=Saccharopolyspora thermophila TaxID=89367 RepID=A0A917N9X9_9PSEU|nr:hypothetical protein GCM10011581_17870 [Saccharopolyspora subtropica]
MPQFDRVFLRRLVRDAGRADQVCQRDVQRSRDPVQRAHRCGAALALFELAHHVDGHIRLLGEFPLSEQLAAQLANTVADRLMRFDDPTHGHPRFAESGILAECPQPGRHDRREKVHGQGSGETIR